MKNKKNIILISIFIPLYIIYILDIFIIHNLYLGYIPYLMLGIGMVVIAFEKKKNKSVKNKQKKHEYIEEKSKIRNIIEGLVSKIVILSIFFTFGLTVLAILSNSIYSQKAIDRYAFRFKTMPSSGKVINKEGFEIIKNQKSDYFTKDEQKRIIEFLEKLDNLMNSNDYKTINCGNKYQCIRQNIKVYSKITWLHTLSDDSILSFLREKEQAANPDSKKYEKFQTEYLNNYLDIEYERNKVWENEDYDIESVPTYLEFNIVTPNYSFKGVNIPRLYNSLIEYVIEVGEFHE